MQEWREMHPTELYDPAFQSVATRGITDGENSIMQLTDGEIEIDFPRGCRIPIGKEKEWAEEMRALLAKVEEFATKQENAS